MKKIDQFLQHKKIEQKGILHIHTERKREREGGREREIEKVKERKR